MTTLFEIGLSNALAATALGVLVWVLIIWPSARRRLRPQWVFLAWVLVLAKLLVPPLVPLPLGSLRRRVEPAAKSVLQAAINPPMSLEVSFPEGAMMDGEPTTNINELLARLSIVRESPELEVLLPTEEAQRGSEPSSDNELGPEASEVGPGVEPFDRTIPPAADAAATLDPVQILLTLWLSGSTLWFLLAAVRIASFRRLLRHARPASAALETEVRVLAARMNLPRLPTVRVVRRRVSPLVWGMSGQATMLLPSLLLNKLTDAERATLLAHELAHLKRRDHLVRLLELAALGLFWWHPVAWWARRNVERAAEHCCDAQVLELFPAQARAYAEALWSTVEFLSDTPSPLPLGASGFSQARDVKRRMEMILAPTTSRRSGRILRVLLPAIGLAILPVSLRSLWAEPPQQAVEVETVSEAVQAEEIEIEKAPVTAAASEEVEVELVQAATQPTAHLLILQAEKPAEKAASVEERLDRLEKMIQTLVDRPQTNSKIYTKSGPAVGTKPTKAPTAVGPPAGISPSDAPAAEAPIAPPSPATPASGAPPESDYVWLRVSDEEAREAGSMLADVTRNATLNLELSKTNNARYEAARRQFEAVEKAFKVNTVEVDQVLEAQRRYLEAYLTYVRVTAELAPDPSMRQQIVAKASLTAVNRELNRSREIWKKTHQVATPGSKEAANEAQAREQYYQLKSQAKNLLNEYQRAQAASAWRGETSIEARKKLALTEAAHKKAAVAVDAKAHEKLKLLAVEAKERVAIYERSQRKIQEDLERAKLEADAAQKKSEELIRQAERLKQEAETAAKKAEAATLELDAVKAADRASDQPKKPSP